MTNNIHLQQMESLWLDALAETDGAVPGKRHRRGVRPSGEATPILPPGGVRSTLHGLDITEAGAVRYPPGSADAPRVR